MGDVRVLAEAKPAGADRAVVLVHEFVTHATDDGRHAANAADLERFVSLLAGEKVEVGEGRVSGPWPLSGCGLYVGKVRVRMR